MKWFDRKDKQPETQYILTYENEGIILREYSYTQNDGLRYYKSLILEYGIEAGGDDWTHWTPIENYEDLT